MAARFFKQNEAILKLLVRKMSNQKLCMSIKEVRQMLVSQEVRDLCAWNDIDDLYNLMIDEILSRYEMSIR